MSLLKKIVIKALFIDKLRHTQAWHDLGGFFASLRPLRSYGTVPANIVIETTNSCNLRCPVCPTHFAMQRKRGNMDFALYRSIIDELQAVHPKPSITLHMAGEPLLCPEIERFVEYAASKGHRTLLSTNATLLTKELSARLLQAGLGTVYLCIDGASKESHEAYRVGSRFESVRENIETFLAVRRDLGKAETRVVIQTLLTSLSEGEMDQMTDWARAIGADTISFKSLSMGSYTTPEIKQRYGYLVPTRKNLRRKQLGIVRRTCPAVLDHALVYWDGSMGLCCVDFDNVAGLPNIREKGFLATFQSQLMLRVRRDGYLKRHPLCRGCSAGNLDFSGIRIDFPKPDTKA